MEQSKALQGLVESADLVKMVEDIIGTGTIDRLSPASMSGMRLTLRNIRDSILASHDTLASDLIARSQSGVKEERGSITDKMELDRNGGNPNFSRKDLRATIDRVRESQGQNGN